MSENTKKWTQQQKAAIYDKGGSLLLSAAAGSGKTAVLVERAFWLITKENPISADKLLIVTFTNAAAEELRSRLALRLELEIKSQPDSIFLKKQRLFLKKSFIGTIDAFCIQLVKEHFVKLGLPADIAVGEEALLSQIRDECLALSMDEMCEKEEFIEFLSLYGKAKSDNETAKIILNIFNFTRSLAFPNKYLNNIYLQYKSDLSIKESDYGKELFAFGEEAAKAGLGFVSSALELAKQDEGLKAYLPALSEDEGFFSQLYSMIKSEKWNETVRILNEYSFPRLGTVRGYEGGAKEQVAALRNAAKSAVSQLKASCFACTEEENNSDLEKAAPLALVICEAVQLFADKFLKAKLSDHVLSFSDFEHLALELLQKERDIISAKYDVIMVDEYQDTNELQSSIYRLLANENESNLFYVGDVKQSIYRFRQAEPGIFLELKKSWNSYESKKHPAVINLGHNFRSSEGVINGLNYLFSQLMSEELGDIEYTEQEKLILGSESWQEEGLELIVGEENEAQRVAQLIFSMVKDGFKVKGENGLRACNYGDFCILLRSRKNILDYLSALESLKIPACADTAEPIFDSVEILPMRALLCAIDNPGDDVSLALAMLGPFYRFSLSEILQIKEALPKARLWAALIANESEKCKDFINSLGYWRGRAAELPLALLCEEIAESTGYYSSLGAMENGSFRQESLLRFIAFSAKIKGGLSSFVRLMQSGSSPKSSFTKSLDGQVSILSIHKSKGLEYPICILADTGRNFNKQSLNERMLMHPQLGLGFFLRQGSVLFPTLPLLAVKNRLMRESLSEEMRILYVALTRAKDKAVIFYTKNNIEKNISDMAAELLNAPASPYILSKAASMGEWLLYAALSHPESRPLLKCTGGLIPAMVADNSRFKMQLCIKEEISNKDISNKDILDKDILDKDALEREKPMPDPALVEKIIQGFNAKPPRAGLENVPVKISVSELAKGQSSEMLARPSFMHEGGLSAAEKGTALHDFLQMASFEEAEKSFEKEVKRLLEEGFMKKQACEALDKNAIMNFLRSDLCGRMKKAKKLYREQDFITSLKAGELYPELGKDEAEELMLVQGISDVVIINDEDIEIVDYKSDKGQSKAELAERYKEQLLFYKVAIEKRYGLPVKKLTIWSFALGEVDVGGLS